MIESSSSFVSETTPTATSAQAISSTTTLQDQASRNEKKVEQGVDSRALEKTYYYQNLKTGSISTSLLTLRQLCKIVCPPASPPSTGTTAGAAAIPIVSTLITPESSILGFDTSTNQYSTDGWKIVNTIPILKECCVQWYYCCTENHDGANHENGSNKQHQQQQVVVKGPVTCRFLAKLLSEDKIKPETKVYYHGSATTSPTAEQQQQQAQTQTQPEWKPIHDIPTLRIAMLAFDTTPPPWQLNTTTAADEQSSLSKVNKENCTTQQNHQEYDASMMTFDTATINSTSNDMGNKDDNDTAKIQDELEAFLSSTAGIGPTHKNDRANSTEDEEGYESDGGTTYVKDPFTGNYIHSALVPTASAAVTSKKSSENNTASSSSSVPQPSKKRKKKQSKAKFSAKLAKCWIYVTGLPLDCTYEEVQETFSKVGIIDLDPETQKPKIRLYRHHDGMNKGKLKGDASICYARPESVELALQVLDESQFIRSSTLTTTTTSASAATRKTDKTNSSADGSGSTDISNQQQIPTIRVQRAKFEQHGDTFESTKKRNISQAKRKVARLAALQAVDWDEGDNGRISGGRKGLRIIVLKHMFDPRDLVNDTDDTALRKLEQEVHAECEQWGTVEKITIFAKNPQGVVIVKFAQPVAASEAIKEYNGRVRPPMNTSSGGGGGGGSNKHSNDSHQKIDANYWDGVTDYTIHDEEKEIHETKKRHDEFGKWLDCQDDLPEEFKLQVEGH